MLALPTGDRPLRKILAKPLAVGKTTLRSLDERNGGQTMSSTIIWILSITMAASALVLTAATEHSALHLALSGIVATVIVALAAREYRAAIEKSGSAVAPLAVVSRYMGMLWAWSAICTFLTYTLIMVWSTWSGAFIVSALCAGLCLVVAGLAERDDGATKWTSVLATFNSIVFGASTIALGAIPVLIGYAGFASGKSDWAAVNIMLTTIGGLAFLSGLTIALKPTRQAA